MDCILYIDLFFLWNFWMNSLVLFVVRQMTKTYRTIRCLLASAIGAGGACLGLVLYLKSESSLWLISLEVGVIIIMNILAFGGKNLLWHLFLFLVSGAAIAGVFLQVVSYEVISMNYTAVLVVSVVCCLFCVLLEKKSRSRWKEEHMKAKTVLEFGDRKLFATALMDTGNRLYDPFFHKPVILVDEKMIKEMLAICREEYPDRLHFIPFQSVGKENGILEGITFDRVSIQWQNKRQQFVDVIAASTKESLYKGKEYQVIFHCGLLKES